MSKNGDVVWADGKSWQRDNEWEGEEKQWWIAPAITGLKGHKTLKELKQREDFEWIVKNGKLVTWNFNTDVTNSFYSKGYNEGYQDGKEDIRKEIASACRPKTWGLDINGVWVDELAKFDWSKTWTR